eukprot:TRINITY_DN7285_c0_g1_i5.p1 TRINITY_DN7285_c0_g1~~TRINITY_DN7285_c0_g1_i5.p1  ORF type:complete len:2384 (+),score=458.96 TRINITY_DN7285_c0_g1_i5:132-7283(+)
MYNRATFAFLLACCFVSVVYSGGYGGWNYETNYPLEVSSNQVVVRDDIIYLLGDDLNDEYVVDDPLYERIWMLNTTTMEWKWTNSHGDIPQRRWCYCAAKYKNELLLFGGRLIVGGAKTNALHSLDMDSFVWTQKPVQGESVISKREWMSCGVVEDRFYVYGGFDTRPTNSFWYYDLVSLQWTEVHPDQISNSPNPHITHMVVWKDHLVVFGGRDSAYFMYQKIWKYDTATEKWVEPVILSNYVQSRYDGAIAIYEDTLYTFGGSLDTYYNSITNAVDSVNLETNAMERIFNDTNPTFPISAPNRRVWTSAAVVNGKLFVVGGVFYDFGYTFNDVWVFNPVQKKWESSSLDQYPLGRVSSSLALVSNTEIGVFGGQAGWESSVTMNDLWIFNTASKSWSLLSREKACAVDQEDCVIPSTNAAFGFFGSAFYVVDATLGAVKEFSLAKKSWISLKLAGQSTRCLQILNPISATFNNQIIMSGGNIKGNNTQNKDVIIFDLEAKSEFVYSSSSSFPEFRAPATGFMMEGDFCFMHLDSKASREIWCWSKVENIWVMKATVSSSVPNKPIVLGYQTSLFSFGGGKSAWSKFNDLWVFEAPTKLWGSVMEQERKIPGRDGGNGIISQGVAYVFFGQSFARSNAIYSLKLNELWCRGMETVTAKDNTIKDGSREFNYQPGTKCSWNIVNVTHIIVEYAQLARGDSLLIQKPEECDFSLKVEDQEYNELKIEELSSGAVIKVPSRKSLLSFNVDNQSPSGQGFSLLLFDCKDGFSARAEGCYCSSDHFINFAGLCVSCPANTKQPLENQKSCGLAKSEVQARSNIELNSVPSGNVVGITQELPSVVYGSVAAIGSRIVLIGGSTSKDETNVNMLRPMNLAFATEKSVNSDWKSVQLSGDLPSQRIHACFVGVGDMAVLIGGRTKIHDPSIYVLDGLSMRWRKMASVLEGIGSTCAAKSKDVYIYGGKNIQGDLLSQLLVFRSDIDRLEVVMDISRFKGHSVYGGGGFVGSTLYIFGGWNGKDESAVLHSINIDNKATSSKEVKIDLCTECSDEGGVCYFGRQHFSFGLHDSELHIYGGVRQGEVLSDVLVIELASGSIIRRVNYGLSNPTLPLAYPSPKKGSASIAVGPHLVLIGGVGSNSLSTNDAWTWEFEMRHWIDTTNLKSPIHRSEASLVQNGDKGFIIFGGSTHYIEELLLNDVWEFSIQSGGWTQIFEGSSTSGPQPRAGAAVAIESRNLIVSGGRTSAGFSDDALWILDLEKRTWNSIKLESTLSIHQRVLQRNGFGWLWDGAEFLLWGGQISSGTGRTEFYSAAASLDSKSSRIGAKPINGTVPDRRKYHSMCRISGNDVLMHGGSDFFGRTLTDTWIYHKNQSSWEGVSYEGNRDFEGFITSTCNQMGLSSIISGASADGLKTTAIMFQHEFAKASPLFFHYDEITPQGLIHQSGMSVSGVVLNFGGRNQELSTNAVFAYSPGFCGSEIPAIVNSHLKSSRFHDGSGEAMYLRNTKCSWNLPNATDLVVDKRMRSQDILKVMDNAGQEIQPKQTTINPDGSLTLLYSGAGFALHMEAKGSEIEQPYPCIGCEGFLATHAACIEGSNFDPLSRECLCKDGSDLVEGRCTSEKNTSDSGLVIGLAVGGSLFAVVVAGTFWGLSYRRKMQSNLKKVEAKLYGIISSQELKFHDSLGEGTFGQVFRGEWRETMVAIKKLKDLQVDSKSLQAFKQEVSVMVELRHPNIVLFMGACFEKGYLCLVSELMEKGSLFDVIHDQGQPLPLQMRLQFMLDIVKGMNYLHSSNPPILHRDLKSPNILVDERFRLKVSDFGLSTLQDPKDAGDIAVGSMLWLAPEVLIGGIYEAPADVYSFGVIAWEIMSRQEPYSDVDVRCIPFVVSSQQKRPKVPEDCPKNITDLIESSWRQDPKQRPRFSELSKSLSTSTSSSVSNSFSIYQTGLYGRESPQDGIVSIVSTCVFGAEELWDDVPGIMGDASMLVVKKIQELCQQYRGFINHCDGDNYVIVFQKISQSIMFCVQLQESLQAHEWSQDILLHKCCASAYEDSLKGLRIKIGLHYGHCQVQSLGNNHHAQYTGNEISLATRICRAARGGQVLISGAAYQEMKEAKDIRPDSVIVREIERGNTPNKGTKLYEAFGKELQRRADLMRAEQGSSIQISLMDASITAGSGNPSTSLDRSTYSAKGDTEGKINEKSDLATALAAKGDFLSLPGPRDAPGKEMDWRIRPEDVVEDGQALGSGSFGTVTTALYKGQKVAVKKIIRASDRSRLYLSFMTEVSTIRKLNHPNIVKFIGACITDSNLAIVLELVQPGNLKAFLLDRMNSINQQQKCKAVLGIIEGMLYLHSSNPPILHRDLKSANVLVSFSVNFHECCSIFKEFNLFGLQL